MKHVTDNSENYRNFYVAFRTGDNSCHGAFLTLVNAETPDLVPGLKLNEDFTEFYGKELINLLDTGTTIRVGQSGEVSFRTGGRSEGIWILREDLKPSE